MQKKINSTATNFSNSDELTIDDVKKAVALLEKYKKKSKLRLQKKFPFFGWFYILERKDYSVKFTNQATS